VRIDRIVHRVVGTFCVVLARYHWACLVLIIPGVWIIPRLVQHYSWGSWYARLIEKIFVSWLIVVLFYNWSWSASCCPRLQASIWAWCTSLKDSLSIIMNVWASATLILVVASNRSSTMTGVSRSIDLSVVYLEDATLRVLELLGISLILHKLLDHFMAVLLLARLLVHTALFASLVYEVALLGCHRTTQVWVTMIILLYLLGDSCASHEAFILLVFLLVDVGGSLNFAIPVKVLLRHHLRAPCNRVLFWVALHSDRLSRGMTHHILFLAFLLLNDGLLSPSLLHRYLLVWVIRCVQTRSPISAKHSLV